MKSALLPLSLILALGALAGPAAAQEDASAETEDEGAVQVTCLRVTGDAPPEGLETAALGQWLIDAGAQVEVLEGDACAEPEPATTTRTKPGKQKGTSYTRFVARGAAAAIELAILAEQHEGADTLTKIDAAARSLGKWAAKQRKWLKNHRPQKCYKAVHKRWRKSVREMEQGADDLHAAIANARWGDVALAVKQVGAGLTRAANVDLETATERCAGGS